jgi:ribosomal peptide maturation radical SAM protein 1
MILARKLKTQHPNIMVIFGGANCEAEMRLATLRNFPFVDAVCLGEGDVAFPEFLDKLGRGVGLKVEGIITRADLHPGADSRVLRSARSPVSLDSLPFPDFDDFFDGADIDSDEYRREHRLIFESSRGCWWGQKNHCTFCGLNGATMGFRQKTGERALQELEFLVQKYGKYTRHVTATDNIMPYNYFSSFLPRLVDLSLEISLFYETKANLKKHQIETYRRAGLSAIQPGIESLSTDVLRIMRKGISALQNIQLLKWCHEFGIVPKWNYLAGFPREDPKWYENIPSLVKKVKHLAPPVGVSKLRFDRFSPYTNDPMSFSITQLDPYPSYKYVYRGLPPDEVRNVAYYFVGHFDGEDRIDNYTSDAFHELNDWKENADEYALFHITCENDTLVFDGRGLNGNIIRLADCFHSVFAKCDGITTLSALIGDASSDARDVTIVFTELERRGIFIREDSQFLNVSIPLDRQYCPPKGAMRKLATLFAEGDAEGDDISTLTIPNENILTLSDATIRNYMQLEEFCHDN